MCWVDVAVRLIYSDKHPDTAVHDPYNHMPKAEFLKLGYPEPIVVHKEVKDRAIRR